jgi:hypothetical protein
MRRFRVTPAHHHGQDRVYVSLPDGTNVAWYDQDSGRVSLLSEALHDQVLSALRPYLTGDVTVGPPPVPSPADLKRLALHPDDDLAPNRPGEALHAAVEARPAPGLTVVGLARKLLPDPRQSELLAHEAVGGQLDHLESAGWRVLHAIPLPGDARLDHLAIGPAGVLALTTLPARGRPVRINDPLVRMGRGTPQPLLRRARQTAERASLALATTVHPVLVVAGAARLVVEPAPQDIRILHDTQLPTLDPLGGVLKPADIEVLYATARDRHSWLRV